MDRIQQANQLVKDMISTLAHLEDNITITSDYDLEILQQCNNNLEVFLDKQSEEPVTITVSTEEGISKISIPKGKSTLITSPIKNKQQ